MVLALLLLAVALCVALAAWAGWFVARDRAVVLRQLWGAAVVEAVLLVQVVWAVVLVATQDHAYDPALFWGYFLTALVLLPVAAVWAFAERTRWSSVVLLVAAVTVAFLEYRLWQIWEG
ncbi:hypothetical protein [Cellulomonas sp. PhB143]|uniref:hypothetical protein n=1 Tax=Cellulomonas sp. PhB143 TaxID=2485186 RepID=UPI000F4AD6A6|nr:hypothetical protein [Cellulomonas sp. PhB143]ROS73037.1 hypothetical protein EDF32_2739 [Cellulomonas sp. PhB143]